MLCQTAGVRADRLHMVRLAIDASRFPQPLNKTEQPSFVHFGRLTGKKGPLITLEALAIGPATVSKRGDDLHWCGSVGVRAEKEGRPIVDWRSPFDWFRL